MSIVKSKKTKIVALIGLVAFGAMFTSPTVFPIESNIVIEAAELAKATQKDETPQPEMTVDSIAESIYETTVDSDVMVEPSVYGHLLGTLRPGISITILKVEGEWGYVREFKGWINMTTLKHIPIGDVIGVVFTRNDQNPMFYSAPRSNAATEEVKAYMTFEIRPELHNGRYYKIGDATWIDRDMVVVDYYSREFYERVVKVPVSRGIRPNLELQRPISMDITQPSGLTLDELAQITDGTELAGIAPSLKKIEEENGVNALFALSVAQLESGNGESYLARAQNNLFGLDANNGGMTFDTKGECIEYFGQLISNHYFGSGLTDLGSVGVVYCENPAWANSVGSLMQRNFSYVR